MYYCVDFCLLADLRNCFCGVVPGSIFGYVRVCQQYECECVWDGVCLFNDFAHFLRNPFWRERFGFPWFPDLPWFVGVGVYPLGVGGGRCWHGGKVEKISIFFISCMCRFQPEVNYG